MKTFVGTLLELKRLHDKEQPDKDFAVCLTNVRVRFAMLPFDLCLRSIMQNMIPREEIVLYCFDPLNDNKVHFIICPNFDYLITRVILFLESDDD